MQKIVFLFIFFFLSCNSWRTPLNIKRENLQENIIKTNGFYYNKRFYYFFLYKNGVFWGGTYANNIESIYTISTQRYFQNIEFMNQTPQGWGVFKIQNNEIFIEKWRGGDGGSRFEITPMSGKILSDSTLYLQARPFGSDTFYFHKTLSKPDSTNRFIK